MALVYLLLGTNMGDKKHNLQRAKTYIAQSGIQLSNESSVYETEPWGFQGVGNFYNQVLQVETILSPIELLKSLQNIENSFGRERKKPGYEDRIIDIDILLFGSEIIQDARLTIPHPLLHLRRFALIPLCELAPNIMHPVIRKKMHEILEGCTDKNKVWSNRKLVT